MRTDLGTIVIFSIVMLFIVSCMAIVYSLYHLNSQTRLKSRLSNFVDHKKDGTEKGPRGLSTKPDFQFGNIEGLREQINSTLAILSSDQLRLKISSAYWPITDIEFVVSRILISIVGLLLGWGISNSIIGGLGLGVLLYLIPGIVLDQSIIRRRKKFQDQLVDFFVLIRGAILIGSSLPQALDLAVREIPAPISEEFNQVIKEIRLGVPLDEALHNLMVRMQSDDLQIIVTALILNNQIGGSLSTILEATIDTIRERLQLFGEVRSLTSYSRYVGTLITLIPFILAVLLFLMNPGYFEGVKTSSLSQGLLIVALFGVIIGNFIIRRIMRIRV